MPLAGHPIVVEVSTDDISYNEVDGLNNISFSPSRDLADTTDFKDTSGAHTKMGLLKDGSASISGDFESGDTNGQVVVRAKFDDSNALWLRVKFDPGAAGGSQGWKVKTVVENSEISTAVDGKIEWSASLQFNGAPTAV